MTNTTKTTALCANCGEPFAKLNDGAIPTHDFPKPARSVCRGSGKPPRRKNR